ncbi:aldehyde dehydrogenase family protein [Caldimonas brevitalea]|uniref:Aldehyde dehydrogenase n=1 Tax=Caldimonas brevitalea TaxID=413882 RepID=A0A0G3BRS5_9BURK|nr:aldehyde dehydrogenase family protein [Caldimonas brevitalea]AKJ30081.1 aldehyde dehydrogenase [Caldimonas brevitalea]
MPGHHQVDALGHAGPYRAVHREAVPDVTGACAAELSIVPRLFVQRSLAALRRGVSLPAEARGKALSRAAELFATGNFGGLSAEAYQHCVSRVSGLPLPVVRAAASIIADTARQAQTSAYAALPRGAVTSWSDRATREGAAVWTRRGEVFAVNAAGNHPGVHALWLEALALGYRLAVRPSRKEPFTPYRLVAALHEAGFGTDQIVLLPTDHSVADDIVNQADLALAYGGDDVVAKYANNTRVLTQGPGRSKILLAGADWQDHLDMIVDSVSNEGGTACVNATAVLVHGDPAPVAQAIAERLRALPSLPPEDERARLPVQPVAAARALEQFLLRHAEGTTAWLGKDGVVEELGDGSAALRPAVFQVGRADAPQTGIELGFPCVWVAPWSPSDGIAPLRHSLVVTVVGGDDTLIDSLVQEPTIRNVYVGNHPTYWMRPGVPHDAYLGEFLMKTKAVLSS